MTYAFVIHNWKFISTHLVMAPGPMVMQFRNLRGVRLLGSMGHLDHDDQWSLLSWWLVQWRANSEPRILNLFCMLVTWMPIKVFLKLAAISFLVTSHVIHFVTDSHPFFAFATSRYTLSWRLRRVINRFKSPCKSTMVSFDLENFEKFWQNGHPIASSIRPTCQSWVAHMVCCGWYLTAALQTSVP